MSAGQRRLVILIENGGVSLGIPTVVDLLLSSTPAGSLIPSALRQKLVDFVRHQIESVTDKLLESAELLLNRYQAARPSLYGDVVVLRDGTASYQQLKDTLIDLSQRGVIIDLLILTHGGRDSIDVTGGITGDKIRDIRKANGKPLSIRSVYMMNCVGSSLNQAWLDAGAKVSAGALGNNYLPEPTTFFFWRNWTAGQPFASAVTSAYQKTVALMNDAVRGFIGGLPISAAGLLASAIDFSELKFVQESSPVIKGQDGLTINSDALSFTQSNGVGLTTTVLSDDLLRTLAAGEAGFKAATPAPVLSDDGLEFLKRWEPSASTDALQGRAREAQQVIHDAVTSPLNANQNDALVTFVCGVGGDAFRRSTMLRLLNDQDFDGAVSELKKWTKVRQDGAVVDSPALLARRAAEAALFGKPLLTSAASWIMSAGALDVDVMYRAFIPAPLVVAPFGIFGGDGRGFQYEGGTERAMVHATVRLTPASAIDSIDVIDNHWSGSTAYNSGDALPVAGKPDWWRAKAAGATPTKSAAHPPGDVLRIFRGVTGGIQRSLEAIPDGASIATIQASGSLPLVPAAPAIDADISLLFRVRGGSVEVKAIGEHDGFPAHELYVNRMLLHSYDPVAAGNGPTSLFPPMDINVRTGWTVVATLTQPMTLSSGWGTSARV